MRAKLCDLCYKQIYPGRISEVAGYHWRFDAWWKPYRWYKTRVDVCLDCMAAFKAWRQDNNK